MDIIQWILTAQLFKRGIFCYCISQRQYLPTYCSSINTVRSVYVHCTYEGIYTSSGQYRAISKKRLASPCVSPTERRQPTISEVIECPFDPPTRFLSPDF